MSGPECIVDAFRTFGEAADAVLLPVLPEDFLSSGQNLVGVCLMSDIKNHLVLGSVEHVMNTHDQFHRPEA